MTSKTTRNMQQQLMQLSKKKVKILPPIFSWILHVPNLNPPQKKTMDHQIPAAKYWGGIPATNLSGLSGSFPGPPPDHLQAAPRQLSTQLLQVHRSHRQWPLQWGPYWWRKTWSHATCLWGNPGEIFRNKNSTVRMFLKNKPMMQPWEKH